MHVKVKDVVVVIAGKDKGKRGAVLSVDHDKERAVVERVNVMKKHAKADTRKGVQGGILEREAAVHVSNLMLVCPKCSEPTRFRIERSDNKNLRACRKCSATIDK